MGWLLWGMLRKARFRTSDDALMPSRHVMLLTCCSVGALMLACSEPRQGGLSGMGGTTLDAALHHQDARAQDRVDAARDSDSSSSERDSGGMRPSDASTSFDAASLPERSKARAMFSGHSLMDNPTADRVESIAAARGDDFGWEQQIVIGSPLRVRTRGNDPGSASFPGYQEGKSKNGEANVLSELASPTAFASSDRYDTLVVADRYDILDVIRWEGTIPYLRHYHDRLLEHVPAARTFFYQTWPDMDKDAPQAWIDYQYAETVAWECAAAKVNASLVRDGKPPAVTVVPIAQGLAELVRRVIEGQVPGFSGTTREKMDAIFIDNVHPTRAAQYLASAMVYAAIFGKSPEGANASPDVPAPLAAVLERIAWETITRYYAANHARSHADVATCRAQVVEMCTQYYAIRSRSNEVSYCAHFGEEGGSFAWPDPSIPLPAP
jgi:hypothetical protein